MNANAFMKAEYGLYVATSSDGTRDNGCIINTFMQVTSNSPFFAVISVNKQNFTHELIQKSKMCNINVLSEKTPFDVFKHFGYQSGHTAEKFPAGEHFERIRGGRSRRGRRARCPYIRRGRAARWSADRPRLS